MMSEYVVVLDMDATLGYFERNTFHVRPNTDYFVQFLKIAQFNVILCSHGMNEYVSLVMSQFLPEVALNAHWIFGRPECEYSEALYGYHKCSEHIWQLYDDPIVLIVLDDGYDLRLYIEPCHKHDESNQGLIEVT